MQGPFFGRGPARFPFAQRPQFATQVPSPGQNNVLLDGPSLLLQAVIIPGDKINEGQLVQAVAIPWFEIIELLNRSPEAMYEIDWRKWEEIIAAAIAIRVSMWF